MSLIPWWAWPVAALAAGIAIYGTIWRPATTFRAFRRQLTIEDLDIAAGRRTRPLDLAGIVIPLHDAHARRCQWCRTEGPDTITRDDCICTVPCGEQWCLAADWATGAHPW